MSFSSPDSNWRFELGHGGWKRTIATAVVTFLQAAALVLGSSILTGCGGTSSSGTTGWEGPQEPIRGPVASDAPSSINVKLFVDATTSMAGYLGKQNRYSQFLQSIGSTLTSGWAQSNIQYFRFGTRVDQIDRSIWRSARSKSFYQDGPISTTTRIDSVLSRIEPDATTIVVTDLFQNESDIAALVERVKTDAFQKGLDAAILGLRSQFDGVVYDAKVGPYQYSSTDGKPSTYRPFYALIFGKTAQIRKLLDVLQSAPPRAEKPALLVSKYVTKRFEANVRKARGAQSLNAAGAVEGKHAFAFALQSEETGNKLNAEISLTPAKHSPAVSAREADGLAMKTYRRHSSGGNTSTQGTSEAGASASAASATFASLSSGSASATSAETFAEKRSDDLRLSSLSVTPGPTSEGSDKTRLEATLQVNLRDKPEGTYHYKTVFGPSQVGGLSVPEWITGYSSRNPSPESGPNQTLNLRLFASNLLRANQSVRTPKIARLFITVRKLSQ